MTIPFRTPTPSPETPAPPRPGPPKGNQNARKHGLYSKQPIPDLLDAFKRAREIQGCGDEIALLRMRIKAMWARHCSNDELFRAFEILNRLLLTHHKLMHPEGDPPID